MKFEAFDEAMRVLPGVTLDIKWETRRTYCVGDRIFVLAGSLGDEGCRTSCVQGLQKSWFLRDAGRDRRRRTGIAFISAGQSGSS